MSTGIPRVYITALTDVAWASDDNYDPEGVEHCGKRSPAVFPYQKDFFIVVINKLLSLVISLTIRLR